MRLIRQGKQVQQKQLQQQGLLEQQQQQAHRIISKLYLRLTRVPRAGHVYGTTAAVPCLPGRCPAPTTSCCCCACALFLGAFPADLCKTVAFFNCIFTRPAGPATAAAPVALPSLRRASLSVRLVRRMFVQTRARVCVCVSSIQFSHICATVLSNVQHIATFIVVVLVLLRC